MKKILIVGAAVFGFVAGAQAGPTGVNSDPSLTEAIYVSNYRPHNGVYNHHRVGPRDKTFKQKSLFGSFKSKKSKK